MISTVYIDRLLDGHPIIAPQGDGWESGVTFNSSAILVTAKQAGGAALRALGGPRAERDYPGGLVAMHYRARPKADPGYPWTRSAVGLVVYTPELRLVKRYSEPIVAPGGSESDFDFLGVEDPRVTYVDGAYYMVYCGVQPRPTEQFPDGWLGAVCMAKSTDLLHWEKLGPVQGTSDAFAPPSTISDISESRPSNKDGILFPDRIDGKYWLLHRPMRGHNADYTIDLARADDPAGPYEDLGALSEAIRRPQFRDSWAGGGNVPVPLGDGRYLEIAHTGNYFPDGTREYVLDAHLYDFNGFDPANPAGLLVARMDGFMRPETRWEVEGPYEDSVANVIFCCGHWVDDGWLYLVYGGGDTYTLAARTPLQPLVDQLEARRNR